MVNNVLTKMYAGFLGMNIGIRLGAPVEPAIWTVERIARTFGDITDYVKQFKHFAADDDANGPVMFLRALDDTDGREPTPEAVGEAYVNYTREGVGMFWWGGAGVSTEHTAYLNLTHGIPAPQSGSIRQNGRTVAEQIGGQIFVDTWGLVAPGDPRRAARYAVAAASVSHDGEGLHGAAFVAACIAAAFTETDIAAVIAAGLSTIPAESKYAAVARAVLDFHGRHPADWKACRQMLEEQWGYDRYPGVCHIIPNAGVCVLALIYGQGSLARTVEIATMCGWDTDCNAGNVGTIAGVLAGIEGIPAHYRKPINDEIVLSGVSGYLNILDIPTYVWQLTGWAYRLANEPVPPEVAAHIHPGVIDFDFSLPGSTHGFCVSDPMAVRLSQAEGALEAMWMEIARGQQCRLYYKPFYRRSDFSDERYTPVFTPTAWPGQRCTIETVWERWNGDSVCVNPYVRDAITGKLTLIETRVLAEPGAYTFDFALPTTATNLIDEVGLLIEGNSPRILFDAGRLLVKRFAIVGKGAYTLSMAQLKKDFGSVIPFSHHHGAWGVEEGRLQAYTLTDARAMTGNYFMENVTVSGSVCPAHGDSHLIAVRVQGTMRGYYAGLHGENRAAILIDDHGKPRELAGCAFPWEADRIYALQLEAVGDTLTLRIDGQALLTARDNSLRWGMAGYAMLAPGRAAFGDLAIQERE